MAKPQLNPQTAGQGAAHGYEALWSRHHAQWRDTAQIASLWQEAADTDPALLRFSTRGRWWETLFEAGITLLVTREYEHLVMALAATDTGPRVSFMRMPHPSGLAVERQHGIVHIASTRNPNQVFDLAPVTDFTPRLDVTVEPLPEQPLVPVRSRFLPGCMYLHDLAVIGGMLYGNAVGHNAVVELGLSGGYKRVWWPRCIETGTGPVFGQNHIQLNSIAAGMDLATSFFSASSDRISARRPGHKNYPVDRRGVIFAGASREVIARGLTRPHSARLYGEEIWVDNSGYGEVGKIVGDRFVPVAKLPGWTRGLCFQGNIAFVGTSRVIPRFRQYAPGLEVDKSFCAVHAVDVHSGATLGSLIWPSGNQIFAVEWVPRDFSLGFPFAVRRRTDKEKLLFYTFSTGGPQDDRLLCRPGARPCDAPAIEGGNG